MKKIRLLFFVTLPGENARPTDAVTPDYFARTPEGKARWQARPFPRTAPDNRPVSL